MYIDTRHQPVVDDGLADFFIEKNIKMLGMDLPSPMVRVVASIG